MIVRTTWPQSLDFFKGAAIHFSDCDDRLSADGGLLLFGQLDQHLGLTQAFADALDDPRDPDLLDHTTLELVRQRVFGILAGYEDQNDADSLRTDPVFKILCGRAPNGDDLASQPTLSRFENAVSIASLKRLRQLFVDHFIDSFDRPPGHLTFDLDAVDDPAHGGQHLSFWHNYYDQNQYFPLVISCAENDALVVLSLRHGTAHATLGAAGDLEYVVSRVRQRWPDLTIYVRADASFATPELYLLCERLRLPYTLGLTANPVLNRQSEALYEQALAAWEQERRQAREQGRPAVPVRLFDGFWYQAGTWECPRFVVVKAEATEQGSQRRFVVTNRPGAPLFPQACYDEYGGRGESENRLKEFKCDLDGGRLSDHRFRANYLRLYLHGLAMNLLVRMRRLVALPEGPVQPGQVPAEALQGQQRRRHFNDRRRRDVLGEGQPLTWRQVVIKAVVRVAAVGRRIVVELSRAWPHLEAFRQTLAKLLEALEPRAASP
jgi:hypothetical protein